MHDLKIIESSLSVLDFAQGLPMSMLTERHIEDRYPSTPGEHIVAYVLGLLLPHDWQDDKIESLTDRLVEPLSQLDTGVDKEAVWQDLFSAAAQVRLSLNQ